MILGLFDLDRFQLGRSWVVRNSAGSNTLSRILELNLKIRCLPGNSDPLGMV